MQFTSYAFILLFLPLFVIGYFLLNKISKFLGKLLIIAAGLVFYFYAGMESFSISGVDVFRNQVLSVAVFGGSILMNLLLSVLLAQHPDRRDQQRPRKLAPEGVVAVRKELVDKQEKRDQPEIAVAVTIEHGAKSYTAVNAARKILDEYFLNGGRTQRRSHDP